MSEGVEGVEDDGVRSVVVQRAGEDRNKGGGIWGLFGHNGVFGRKREGT